MKLPWISRKEHDSDIRQLKETISKLESWQKTQEHRQRPVKGSRALPDVDPYIRTLAEMPREAKRRMYSGFPSRAEFSPFDFIVGMDGSWAMSYDVANGKISSNTNSETLIQGLIDGLSSGGSIYVRRGTYGSCSLTLRYGVRLILEKGATSFTVSIYSGGDGYLEDLNDGHLKYWVSGSLVTDFDLANGDLNLVSGAIDAEDVGITIGTTLADWRHASDLSRIDGADLYAGSVPYSALATGALLKQATYIIRMNGSDCEAIAGSTGLLAYGGSGDAGGIDGGNPSAVINAAITAGGAHKLLFLKAGTYLCSAAITLLEGTVLMGEGRDATILQNSQTGGQTLVTAYFSSSTWDVQLIDLQLLGNANSGYGLHARYAHGLVLTRVKLISHGKSGLYAVACYEMSLYDPYVESNGERGIFLEGCSGFLILGGRSDLNTLEGLRVTTDTTTGLALRLSVEQNGSNQVFVADSQLISLSQLYVDGGGDANGIDLVESGGTGNVYDTDISSCLLFNCVVGVKCEGADRTRISKCCLHTNTIDLLFDSSADDCLVWGNSLGSSTPVSNSGARNRFRDNPGYVTEANGNATVSAGNATKVVTHGLAVTPSVDKIELQPEGDLLGRRFWPSGANATSFTINLDSADTIDHVFGWRYD